MLTKSFGTIGRGAMCYLAAVFATLAAAAVTMGTFTPSEAVPSAVRRACKYDYKRVCRHYKVGTSKMRNCMAANVGQLSPRCYNKLVQYGYGKRRRR